MFLHTLVLLYKGIKLRWFNRNVKEHIRSNNLGDLIVHGVHGAKIKNFNEMKRESLLQIDLTIMQSY